MLITRNSCPILINLYFLDKFSQSTQLWNFMKFRPMGAELFHADGYDKANSLFSKLCGQV
jgi:hypothetical protein